MAKKLANPDKSFKKKWKFCLDLPVIWPEFLATHRDPPRRVSRGGGSPDNFRHCWFTRYTIFKFKNSFIFVYYFSIFFYRCVECDKKFSVKRPPRLCDYTGLSFCPDCHWNAMAQTPARIIHNWDFSPRPVSQATKQYLFLMQRKPVIDISQANHKVPN